MRAGELKNRIVIQQNSPTRDAYGAAIPSWSTVDTVWGRVADLTGREFEAAQKLNAEVTSRIKIRYRSGVTPAMRATWSGHTYDILAVIEKVQDRELWLLCKELVL